MRVDIPCRELSVIRLCLGVLMVFVSQHVIPAAELAAEPQSARTQSAPLVSFTNDIAPILTKAGCNTGVCHAKAGGGQNGFQLSLLGFEPLEDYEHLVREGRARRISLAAPDQSLLLLKATGQSPHRGGIRIATDSPEHELLRRWIAQGAPLGPASDPVLQSIEIQPSSGVLDLHAEEQLRAIAHYSNSSTRDVTNHALYETNDRAMIGVNDAGLVNVFDLPGKAAVMVRYQGQVDVYTASIPLPKGEVQAGTNKTTDPPPVNNFIDEFVFANLRTLRISPSQVCDDATFIRRVTLDIAGRLPNEAESQAFFADESEDRRDRVIDDLLRTPDYADYFANKWTSLLKNRRDDKSDITSNFAFHAWLRDNLLANTSYDQIVRELLAATGTVIGNPAVAWYKRVIEPKDQIEDVAQLFLGVRMQCAQCHHHPFERWSQDDYYGLAAFFSQVGRKPTAIAGEDLIFHKRGIAGAKNMKTGQTITPRALGDDLGEITADEDPRLKLADWMKSSENTFFAKSLVNRYWKHFFDRGLIEPEDDIRDTNPPTNPELLAALEDHFISSGFDLKELVRVITQSSAYQLSSEPNESNLVDRQNFSRFYPKRLQAEVMLDAIDMVAKSRTDFANLPAGTRAIALPDNSYNTASPFLRVFGRPEGTSVCECERVQSASLAQSLHLINASDIKGKLAFKDGRADQLAKGDSLSDEDQVRELYLAAFSRYPTANELSLAQSYLSESRTKPDGAPVPAGQARRESLQDLIWALINTKEFLFNH